MRFLDQGECGEGLEEGSAGGGEGDGRWGFDGVEGGDGGVLGVGACGGHVDDAVAGGEVGGGRGGEDGAGGFFAEDEGEGGGVEACAEVAGGRGR